MSVPKSSNAHSPYSKYNSSLHARSIFEGIISWISE